MRIPSSAASDREHQRGVALFVALIVMVAMSLAGVALIRSIDTTTSVTGNIAFRQSALLQANWAIEDAIAHVYTGDTKLAPGAMIDTTNDDTANFYLATFDPAKDSTKSAQPALPSGHSRRPVEAGRRVAQGRRRGQREGRQLGQVRDPAHVRHRAARCHPDPSSRSAS